MKRRVFVKWTLTSAVFPLAQCDTRPSGDPPDTIRLAGVSMNPAAVWGGTSSIGTVTLSGPAPAGGATVALSSNNTMVAQVPVSVTVPVGATTATFTVATSSVAADTPVTISATHDTVTRTANLTVTVTVATLTAVSMSPATVLGGTSSTGTVTLSGPAPVGGVTVVLSSNNTTAAQVPASVTVPAGATTATFTVATSSVAADTSVTITATHNSVSRTATLMVTVTAGILNPIFRVSQIAENALTAGNHHLGVDALIRLMGENGLKFYRSSVTGIDRGPQGLIAPRDVVLIKVNAQWKYRGCTNSDLVRGLVQAILDHPEGFQGEVVIFENGQGRGSLNCDTSISYNGNTEVHANAQDESHSFLWLIDHLFYDPRVSGFLLDSCRSTFITESDHVTNGYRRYESVSYPCFTTAGGQRIELREGVWNGSSYDSNLKLINCPVLKTHEPGGCEITGALKHVYGIVTMDDGHSGYRHFTGLGPTCGTMMVSVQTPVLNIMDAIWVSHASLRGTPSSATFRANQLVASQDPVALDYWTAKYVLYPIDNNERHHPDFPGVDVWLTGARDLINGRGGFNQAAKGVQVRLVTKTESEMRLFETVP